MNLSATVPFLRTLFRRVCVAVGAIALTLVFFLVLPLIQVVGAPRDDATDLQSVDAVSLPPPPAPLEEEPPKKDEEKEEPPELEDESPPLDLSQLELALNAGLSEGILSGDFAVNLNTAVSQQNGDVDALFSLADLDQTPRVMYQPNPVWSAALRKRAPGAVTLIFVVNDRGRVENPIVQSATDRVFESAAINSVKQWKFEPGKRNGQTVAFRMKVTVTFPKE